MSTYNHNFLYVPVLLEYDQKPKIYTKEAMCWFMGTHGLKKFLFNKLFYYNHIFARIYFVQNTSLQRKNIFKNFKKLTSDLTTIQNKIMGLLAFCIRYLRAKGIGYKFNIYRYFVIETIIGYTHKFWITLPHEFHLKHSKKFKKLRFWANNWTWLENIINNLKIKYKPNPYTGKGLRGPKTEKIKRKPMKKKR